MLQLVLYICSKNAEVDENPEQKKIYRKPKSETQIKDRYREIQKWDVGQKTGQNIRKYNPTHVHYVYEGKGETGTSSPKRPHLRSGHWHHYWTGPKDGERTLVLNWVAPTFIHGEQEIEPTTNLVEFDTSKVN
jgi:hypothetical protein